MLKVDTNTLQHHVKNARAILQDIGDGTITPSAYDTAWVARIPHPDYPNRPLFVECLDWLLNHQLPDGSWGSELVAYYHDRLVSTLSAVITLRIWGQAPDQIELGEAYIRDNLDKIEAEQYSTVGFEIIFTTMLDTAYQLKLNLPYNHPAIVRFQKIRDRKLAMIPLEVVYRRPTTLLHSLEGLDGILDVQRVMAMQAANGSFLNSPSATAYIYMHTGDAACLQYIQDTLQVFGDCVPVTYPLDLFERLWVLNNIYELGIAHHFTEEIAYHLSYIREHFADKGVPWSRFVQVPDIDDTSVAFKILRLNYENVSSDVFYNFFDAENHRFFCFPGELDASMSHMMNLYQAAQLGGHEEILEKASTFTRAFLSTHYEKEEFHDKWLIWENLGDYMAHLLSHHWLDMAPFVARSRAIALYEQKLESIHWLDKVVYYLPHVNARFLLDVAMEEQKAQLQTHQYELEVLNEWATSNTAIWERRVSSLLFFAYNLFPHPDEMQARLIFCKISLWVFGFDDLLDNNQLSSTDFDRVATVFLQNDEDLIPEISDPTVQVQLQNLNHLLRDLLAEVSSFQQRDVSAHIYELLHALLNANALEENMKGNQDLPDFDTYMDFARTTIAVRFTLSFAFYAHRSMTDNEARTTDLSMLLNTASDVIRILNDIRSYEREQAQNKANAINILMTQSRMSYDHAVQWLRNYARVRMQDILKLNLEMPDVAADLKTIILDTCRVTSWLYTHGDFHTIEPEFRPQ